jgi:hypothetical protein
VGIAIPLYGVATAPGRIASSTLERSTREAHHAATFGVDRADDPALGRRPWRAQKFGYGKEKPKTCDCATHGGVSLRVDTKKGLQNGVRLDDPIAC